MDRLLTLEIVTAKLCGVTALFELSHGPETRFAGFRYKGSYFATAEGGRGHLGASCFHCKDLADPRSAQILSYLQKAS